MTDTVPLPVVRYFAARTPVEVADAFPPDGIAHDEGRTHQGHDAIRQWREGVAKVSYRQDLLSARTSADRTTVATHLTGDFPGSPVDLRLTFDVTGDRVAQLTIG
ncbi:hypothetical protein SAMN04488003_101416 [Loktanella fryxellensis]|uniref:SnoaL-like domain-containing protein n=1 Tax=Loktanella fryxellensis TaxID=245187 RepID=A0A1H7Z282_9RHOB|nr:nuclear transport factor 2 family protein [Loktanella fryxellensis]SEM52426.1 hypothetical protein SAMN04488003_101416 [Loktanella fryxellensis]